VGDAACQVKATTGGGIVQSLAASKALGDSIANSKGYEKLWRKEIGRDLKLHLRMRNIMDKFSEADWHYLIRLLSREKTKWVVESHERDYPSRFMIKLLLKEPRLLYFIRHLV
jgi:digeranylgeranylglycerophospholipid reductase